jgi:transcriptional regulator with XRE-family HTH domain
MLMIYSRWLRESPVRIGLMIKQRLRELGLEQKDLATAAGVTDSYISQLVARKKLPPFPDRTDIYAKMEKFLRLRDQLNFREASDVPLQKYGDAAEVERQMQTHARRGAIERWAKNKYK